MRREEMEDQGLEYVPNLPSTWEMLTERFMLLNLLKDILIPAL